MATDLEQLAEQGKARREAKASREVKATAQRKQGSAPRRKHGKLLLRSLRSPTLQVVLFVVATAALAGVYFPLEGDPIVQNVAILVCVGVGVMVLRSFDRWCLETQVRWLRSLPFEFDQDVYFAALGTDHGMSATVTVRVIFESAPPESERQTLADVIVGVSQHTDASFDGAVLVARSPSLKTESRSKNGSIRNNGRVHRWFRKLAGRALSKINGRHPIARVELLVS